MDIGTGIAIAGAWLFAGACALSPTVTSKGFWYGVLVAGIVTGVVLYRIH
jgi:hypothetical protein